MDNEVKSCPFCKGRALIVTTNKLKSYVVCNDCGNRTAKYDLRLMAIEAWNRRAE